jgi:hypothetical protein
MALMCVPERALSFADLYGAPEDLKICAVGLTSSTWAPLEASSTNTLVASTSRVRIDERKRILGVNTSLVRLDEPSICVVRAQALLSTCSVAFTDGKDIRRPSELGRGCVGFPGDECTCTLVLLDIGNYCIGSPASKRLHGRDVNSLRFRTTMRLTEQTAIPPSPFAADSSIGAYN